MHPDASLRSCYLIVLNQVVVAQDLAQTIAERDPDADVLMARDAGQALRLMADLKGGLVLAFLQLDPKWIAEDPLAAALRAHGCPIVLIGDAAEDFGGTGAGGDWLVLPRPFTTDTVLAVIHSALSAGNAEAA